MNPAFAQIGPGVKDVEAARAGTKLQVIVLIDADGRPDLDALEQAAHEISPTLNTTKVRSEADLGVQGYTLEVSIPGTDAPLTQLRH